MEIRWLGHAGFIMTSENGVKVMTDPSGDSVGYPLPREVVDVVTVSHGHHDHNAVGVLPGKPEVIDTPGPHPFKDVSIEGFSTFHDPHQGAQRGRNIVYRFVIDGLRVVHCGDLGHQLDASLVEKLKPVDVLMVPVGSVYTIDAEGARQVAEALQPRVIIPMHFQTPCLLLRLEPVENFTRFYSKPKKLDSLNITEDTLPQQTEVVILNYPEQPTEK
ncbi:MAG: MBL fold metallo-hydrolase [Firmicutes bacterium]|nr:MBL fold metallo-hydrolase [Bacillota bacterium]